MTFKLNALISKATGFGRTAVAPPSAKAPAPAPATERSSGPQIGKPESNWGKKPELPEIVIHGIL